MKSIQSLFRRLIVCSVAVAMVSSIAAQTSSRGVAKVVQVKGGARYTTGNNVWLPLRVGALLKPGTVIQTAEEGSFVDLALGDTEAPLAYPMPAPSVSTRPASPDTNARSYAPTSEANMVRLFENSVLAIDKLSSTTTGADVVTETQLDLQRGRMFGNVKKMSGASKYEVKMPNGVAGVRGTIYSLNAQGVVQVVVGSVVIAYVGADGNVVTQVVMGGQQFDTRTGQISPIPDADQKALMAITKEMRIGPKAAPTTFTVDHTIYYVSPTSGISGGAAGGD